MRTSRLIAAGAAVAAATSFYYTLAYVARWEWNRAQMAGTFTLLAALIAAVIMVDARMREVRRSLDRLGDLAEQRGAAESVAESAPARSVPALPARARPALADPATADHQDFAWLTVKPERYGVFIPLLLGAGMLASGIAWVVERVFARTAEGFGRRTNTTPEKSSTPRPSLPDSLLPPADTGFDAYDFGADESGPGIGIGIGTATDAYGTPAARPDPADLWLRGKAWETSEFPAREGART
ncbi:hypothetical protein OG216_11840 [Streptomycetaceae bacterium NBC_01309]